MAAVRRRPPSKTEREASRDGRVELLPDAVDEREPSSPDIDVPAAVVCARCGDADCSGCADDLGRSGIVSVVAWERLFIPMPARLWSTAMSATRDAEKFFEHLPDGPVLPALGFAAICELLAVSAVFLPLVALAAVVMPDWTREVALDASSRSFALRLILGGLPAFAGLVVLAHLAHALSIDSGATRNGARSARSRALRFGLYACGWDFIMSPLGALVLAIKEGPRAMMKLVRERVGLPTQATLAFLRGAYRIDEARARRALVVSWVGASIAVLAVVGVVIAAVAMLLLA